MEAGLRPWPKPWQNLRSSRATELADKFPSHVCAAWLGHTEAVADEFYRQVTDDHFARAIGERTLAEGPESGPVKTEKGQNRSQQDMAECTHKKDRVTKKPAKSRGKAAKSETTQLLANSYRSLKVGDTGFEPVTSAV